MSWVGRLGFVALVGVAACGSDSPGSPGIDAAGTPVTITFLRHDNPTYLAADTAFFQEYMAAHPNVKILDTTVDFRTVASQLNGNLKNDSFAYDFVLVPPGRLCSYANNLLEVPADIQTLTQAGETFFAAPLGGSVCNNKLMGLPVESNLEYGGVVVNLDKYEAKFPGKTPGWADWSSFIAEAAALTEYDAAGMPMANGLDIDPGWSPPTRHIFFAQILQRGGTFWTAEGNFAIQTPEALASLTAMVEWVTTNKVMFTNLIPNMNTGVSSRLAKGATEYGWSDPTKPLSVMGYMGTWGVPATKAQLPTGSTWRFDFFPLPPVVGTQHKFVTDSGWAFAVPRTSKHPAVAWDIIKSLALSPAKMKAWSAITGALPALKVNGSAAAAAADPVLARVQPLLEAGIFRGYVPAEAIDAANGAVVSNFFAAVKGQKPVAEALRDMEATANAAIAQYK